MTIVVVVVVKRLRRVKTKQLSREHKDEWLFLAERDVADSLYYSWYDKALNDVTCNGLAISESKRCGMLQ